MKIGKVQTTVVSHCLDCDWKRNRADEDTQEAIKHAHTRGHKVKATITLSSCYDGRQHENKHNLQEEK